MTYKITSHNICIPDSYRVSKHNFDIILDSFKLRYPNCEVWVRSKWSLKAEWACHNILYSLGIARRRTKDVDLNYPLRWYIEGAYIALGTIVWLFIK